MINKLKYVILILILIHSTISAQYDFEAAFPNLTFSSALDLQNSGDGTNRIFVAEQDGIIKVFPNEQNVTSAKIFLDITDRVTSGGETGLLGLAFHPDYESNGYLYVNYTAPDPLRTVISRFQVSSTNPDSADKNTEQILLEYNQPFSNHNGGCVAFGPDGYLYIAAGDGGSGGDPQNNAQNINNLLGKIIKIDVDNHQTPFNYGIPSDNPFVDSTNVDIRKEIYAWGLRNPWRFSFDFTTGWLWAADVGQGDWEEVDIIENGGNYGWRCYEGNHAYNISGCNAVYDFPIWEYSHSLGFSITGGYVYRGQNVPELTGKYICGDYVSTRVWAIEYDGVNPATSSQITTAPGSITSFGEDENKELYLVSFNGKIYRFVPTVVPVELITFDAAYTNGKVILSWYSDTETNNAGFMIERSSDGANFEQIIFIGGSGTTPKRNVYSYTDESVKYGIYYYRLKQINYDGSFEYLKVVAVDLGTPKEFVLEQNYPNPFNPNTTIKYYVPEHSFVTIKIYDVLGNEIKTLINDEKSAGYYKIDFDASQFSSGIYFYVLKSNEFVASQKMLLIK
jgi:glucose/arabinose dehydrogenase